MARSRKAIIIHSPYSGRSSELPEALTYLRQSGVIIADVLPISALDGLPPQGKRWQEQGVDIAIAAGGDGLVGGIITHIAESSILLGILPLGTANDVARSINIPQDLRQAAEVIANGRTIEIDIGAAQPAEQAPHTQGAAARKTSLQKHGYFAHALTLGVNVQFAQLATNVATRQRYGRLTYPLTALEVMRNHAALDMEITFEGLALRHTISSPVHAIRSAPVSFHCHILLAAVINAPIFGGALQLSIPGSQVDDRLLDILIIEDIGGSEYLNTLIDRIFNASKQPETSPAEQGTEHILPSQAELIAIPGVHYVQAQGVVIKTSTDPQDVTLDGEIRGRTPIHVCMADERARIVIPH